MKKVFAISAIVAGLFASQGASAATFVLVHGAFADAHAWDAVKPILEAQGNTVIAIDLPGRNVDPRQASAIHLSSYVQKTEETIRGIQGKVILVGHSLGGMVISQVEEDMPERIEKAVYVSAFLPANGDTAMALLQQDKQSILGPYLAVSADGASATIKPEGRVSAICDDCSADIKSFLAHSAANEPMQPFSDAVSLSKGRFGSVPKAYIFTSRDKTLGYDVQRWMQKRNGETMPTAVLDTSHLSFLVAPDRFATELLRLSKTL